MRLLIILRLAVLLNRSRKEAAQIPVTVDVTEDSVNVHFDADWLGENPLTIADLERERGYLQQVGYDLKVQ
jgi:exopolyphosphatase/guanosine-5'-triphosphate,3'-diphosphate pyrophosphatase